MITHGKIGPVITRKYLSEYRSKRYTNWPDFINPEPKVKQGTVIPAGLEQYITEYKQTQDPDVIKYAMLALDKLIIKMLHQERRKYAELQNMEMQDLYQASFICLHHAMLKFDITKSSIFSFPRYLQGYIKKEIKKVVDEKKELVCCGIAGADIVSENNTCTAQTERAKRIALLKIDLNKAMERLVDEGKVSKEDMSMMKMRYMEGYTYKEIAEKMSGEGIELTEKAVKCRVGRAVAKLKRTFKNNVPN